jgi:predicted amidohydrolase YtcJ
VPWLLRDVVVAGARVDCRLADGLITYCGPTLPLGPGDQVFDGRAGVLLPGLADHHIHLLATAAAAASVDVSGGLGALLATHGSGWVRGVGARHELTRADLDAVDSRRPTRVQHRGGSLWTLNSPAVELLRPQLSDVEAQTGQVWRGDHRLRLGVARLDLPALGRQLTGYGITHVTDATPGLSVDEVALLSRSLPQHVSVLMPGKIVIADHAMPDLAELVARIGERHAAGRPVALHCLTRVALALAIAALSTVGTQPGDRIEHAAVCDDAAAARLAELGVTVVTQPSLIARHGDDYLADSDPADRPYLWRYAGLLTAGVPVVASSDAPYGDLDPWQTMAAAMHRRTPSGVVLGPDERVPLPTVLESFWSSPGGPHRTVGVGEPADLCLLQSWPADPSTAAVAAVFIGGELIRT